MDFSYAKECLDRALDTLETHPGRIQQRLVEAKQSALDNFPLSGLPGDLQPLFQSTVESISEDVSDDKGRELVETIIGLRHQVVKRIEEEERSSASIRLVGSSSRRGR